MKTIGNILFIACLLMAGGWLWLTSTLHQERSADVWLMTGILVFVGIAIRYLLAAWDRA